MIKPQYLEIVKYEKNICCYMPYATRTDKCKGWSRYSDDLTKKIPIYFLNISNLKIDTKCIFVTFVTPYSGVPNKSAARLLIQGIFSFQHTLIRSNTLIKNDKNFLPICLFGPKHSKTCKTFIDIEDEYVFEHF